MSITEHVEKLKREAILIRSAYQIGQMDAGAPNRPKKDLERWSPAVRTAYLFSMLLKAPDAVSADELTLMDWEILSGIEIRHVQR